jgi:hypothetical protein
MKGGWGQVMPLIDGRAVIKVCSTKKINLSEK